MQMTQVLNRLRGATSPGKKPVYRPAPGRSGRAIGASPWAPIGAGAMGEALAEQTIDGPSFSVPEDRYWKHGRVGVSLPSTG
jgi:hypothetical protein